MNCHVMPGEMRAIKAKLRMAAFVWPVEIFG
jgi:hypothetical protein